MNRRGFVRGLLGSVAALVGVKVAQAAEPEMLDLQRSNDRALAEHARGNPNPPWLSDEDLLRLNDWNARRRAEALAPPPVVMCSCPDLMTCEHAYPQILRGWHGDPGPIGPIGPVGAPGPDGEPGYQWTWTQPRWYDAPYVPYDTPDELRELIAHRDYVNRQIAEVLALRPIAPVFIAKDGDVFERIPTPGVPDAQVIVNRTAPLRRQIEALHRKADV